MHLLLSRYLGSRCVRCRILFGCRCGVDRGKPGSALFELCTGSLQQFLVVPLLDRRNPDMTVLELFSSL